MGSEQSKYWLNDFWSKKVSSVLLILGGVCLLLAFLDVWDLPHSTHASSADSSVLAASSSTPNVVGGRYVNSLAKFFHSYLSVYSFYMAIVLGSIFFVILQSLTKAGWSVSVRRVAEVYGKNIGLMAFLALPLLIFGMSDLYHWTHESAVKEDALLQAKQAYLNLPFFYVRIVGYFVALFFIARFYANLSTRQDVDGDVQHTLKMQKYSPVAMLVFGLCLTFFSFDFLMSLMPHWYSTIWGVYYFASCTVSSLAVLILSFLFLRRIGYLKNEVTVEHYHDLGKLLFAFNLFWAYVAFSQYMLIWYANIPETTIFYLDRINAGWLGVSLWLLLGHVFIPIVFYVSRNVKRNFLCQTVMCGLLLFMELIHMFWVVLPNTDKLGLRLQFSDSFVFLGMSGLFFGLFLRNLGKVTLLPIKDPRLEESLNFKNI